MYYNSFYRPILNPLFIKSVVEKNLRTTDFYHFVSSCSKSCSSSSL